MLHKLKKKKQIGKTIKNDETRKDHSGLGIPDQERQIAHFLPCVNSR